jgi:hypothetical protein
MFASIWRIVCGVSTTAKRLAEGLVSKFKRVFRRTSRATVARTSATCGALLFAVAIAASSVMAQDSVGRMVGAKIDQERFLKDFSAAADSKGASSAPSSRVKSAYPTPPVPLFVHPQLLADFNKGASTSKGAVRSSQSETSSFIVDEDGYVATHAFDRFMFSVRGTNQVYLEPGVEKSVGAQEDYRPRPFTETESGGVITFGYAGANYIASFDCTVGDSACVTSDEANRIVSELLVCVKDGRCIDNGAQLIRSK